METYITLIFLSWITKRMTFPRNIKPLSSRKYLLNAYNVTEPVLGTGNLTEAKAYMVPTILEHLVDEKDIHYIIKQTDVKLQLIKVY